MCGILASKMKIDNNFILGNLGFKTIYIGLQMVNTISLLPSVATVSAQGRIRGW